MAALELGTGPVSDFEPGRYPRGGMNLKGFSGVLEQALKLRQALNDDPKTSFYRLLSDSETSGTLTLERIAKVGVLSLYREFTPVQELELARQIVDLTPLETLYLKRRPLEARHRANVEREYLSPPEPLSGPGVSELEALENGVRFVFRPGADLSIGLFSDMRGGRRWLRENARGRVLNTFAYTCGLGLNAALSGHAVKNLDASKKVLEWGGENYRRNALEPDPQDFIYGDVFDWLGRLFKRGERFETVVLDPPSFARGSNGVFRVERDYGELVERALKCLTKDGLLMACTNHAGLSSRAFEKQLLEGCTRAGRGFRILERLSAGMDYPGDSALKIVALEVG